jgi:protein phosphatase 2C-like protein
MQNSIATSLWGGEVLSLGLSFDREIDRSSTVTDGPEPEFGSATKSSKLTNEDSHGVYRGAHLRAVVCADGVGSSKDSHVASALVVQTFLEAVSLHDYTVTDLTIADVRRFWRKTQDQLVVQFQEHAEHYLLGESPWETTLITIVETDKCYFVSYIGNGGVTLVRGDFWEFLPQRWPWCVQDIMLGHSVVDSNGHDLLYRALSPRRPQDDVPVIVLTKDSSRGEILVATTDGISSPDHQRLGRGDDGRLWQEVNPQLSRLLRGHLAHYLVAESEKQTLAKELEAFLEDGLFDDDATLGVLVSAGALSYSAKKRMIQHE